MKLVNISYEELVGSNKEWRLKDMSLEEVNLIVGRNASGKSRSLSIIWSLAARVSSLVTDPLGDGVFRLDFVDGSDQISYNISIVERKIVFEEYIVNGIQKLTRGAGGSGKIYAEQEGRDLAFQAPQDHLAVVIREDKLQHSFLDKIINWAKGVYYIPFGTSLGREHFVMFQEGGMNVNARDSNQVTGIYRDAFRIYGEDFKNRVIADMQRIGYHLEDVGITQSSAVTVMPMGAKLSCLYVKERDLAAEVEQNTISQGMFRALSTLIQVNYGLLSESARLIIIDDIGEGLDYSRSCDLISLIVERIKGTSMQLIASTNDRFVMNGVDIKYWTILDRKSNIVYPLNYRNSKEIFDEFRFTGLSNFDFLSREFFKDSPQ